MRTTVNLQELFTYSPIPMIIIGIIVLAMTIYILLINKKKEVTTNKEVNIVTPPVIKNIQLIKNKYLQNLDNIENDYRNNKISLRKAYQLISETIRLFVYDVTGIKAQNFSLMEIKKLNMPQIYELIAEYYEPEFASKTIGDLDLAINKARGVINQWR